MNPRLHGSNLDDVADDEQDDTERQTPPTSPPVGSVGTRKSTDERSDAHQGHHGGLNDGNPFPDAILPNGARGEAALKVLEDEHARDLTRVVTEKKATQAGDSAEEERLDAALGAIDPDGPVQETNSTLVSMAWDF